MSSTIPTASNAERNTEERSQMCFGGDLNILSQSNDVLRGFLRLRKLLPLKCNGSEQLKSGADISKYTRLIN
jgi:hypothetical protein